MGTGIWVPRAFVCHFWMVVCKPFRGMQVKVRFQTSDMSTASTSYAPPSILSVNPNGTAATGGEATLHVPTAGGIKLTILARNVGALTKDTRLRCE
jgi:hypothetical protein